MAGTKRISLGDQCGHASATVWLKPVFANTGHLLYDDDDDDDDDDDADADGEGDGFVWGDPDVRRARGPVLKPKRHLSLAS